jgi:hypothetical protein
MFAPLFACHGPQYRLGDDSVECGEVLKPVHAPV